MSPTDLCSLLGSGTARVAHHRRSGHLRCRWRRGPLHGLGLFRAVIADYGDDGVDLAKDEFAILLAAQRLVRLVLLATRPALPAATATRRSSSGRTTGAHRSARTRRGRARKFGFLRRGGHRRTGWRQRLASLRPDTGSAAPSPVAATCSRFAQRVEVFGSTARHASPWHTALALLCRTQCLLERLFEPLCGLPQSAAQT